MGNVSDNGVSGGSFLLPTETGKLKMLIILFFLKVIELKKSIKIT